MGNVKSHADEYFVNLVTETLADGYALLSVLTPHLLKSSDFSCDVSYIRRRVDEEGLSFLTVTLPRLGDWCDQYVWGLQVERVEGFKPYDGLFPVFLRPFWKFFHERQNTQVDQSYADVYRFMRTLLHGLKKLDVSPTEEQIAEKLSAFLSIEEELEGYSTLPTPVNFRAQHLLEDFTRGYNATCSVPKHGPGAVAGGERNNEKWVWTHLYESVHKEWPYWKYYYPVCEAESWRFGAFPSRLRPIQLAACAAEYRSLLRIPEPTARLLFVPKDSRGPRVISCEPKELMYLQQGVATDLMNFIEKHPYTTGHVNFERQEVNRDLAFRASSTKEWATMDLSDASDRVSVDLVTYLFPERVTRKWLSLRSTGTLLPNGTRIPLRKFAPMGSALCFPVESLVFWAISVAAIWESSQDLDLALSSCYVYGDDIIVKSEYQHEVARALEACCLKVNMKKSFGGNHPFRESCGIDAYEGFDVTPLRVKKFPPRRPTDGDGLVAYVKYAEISQYAFPKRSRYLLQTVERTLRTRVPRVPFPQPYLSLVTKEGVWSREDFGTVRWNPESSYWQFKGYNLSKKKVRSCLDGWKRLQSDLKVRPLGDPSMVVERSSTQIRTKYVNITFLGF